MPPVPCSLFILVYLTWYCSDVKQWLFGGLCPKLCLVTSHTFSLCSRGKLPGGLNLRMTAGGSCHSSLFQHIEHLPDTMSQRRCASLHPTRRVLCLHSVNWHISPVLILGTVLFPLWVLRFSHWSISKSKPTLLKFTGEETTDEWEMTVRSHPSSLFLSY